MRREHLSTRFASPVALSATLAVVSVAIFVNRWVCEDAFITFRYARNLANGLGLRFNLGPEPPVEGYSNFLWVLLSAIPEYFSWRPWLLVGTISAACGLVVIWRIYRFCRQRLELDSTTSALVCLVAGLSPPFLIWSTSGLETMAFCLAIFVVAEQLLLEKDWSRRWVIPAGVALILLRPEGFAWVLGISSVAWVLNRPKKLLTHFLFPSAAALLALILFRLAYFGRPMPNTYYTKIGWTTGEWKRGLDYVLLNGLTILLPFFVAIALALAFWHNPSRRRLLVILSVMAGAPFAYSMVVGGDYMAYGRFLLPGVPFLAMILAVAIEPLAKASSLPRRILAGATLLLIILVGLAPRFDIYLVPNSVRSQFHIRQKAERFRDENEQLMFMKRNSIRMGRNGRRLARISPPGSSIILGAVGNLGYFSNFKIYDTLGLVTRLPDDVPRRIRSPGHDLKVDHSYFLPQEPTYYAIANRSLTAVPRELLRQEDVPYPYAPVVHLEVLPNDLGTDALILYTRMGSDEEYRQQWQKIETEYPRPE